MKTAAAPFVFLSIALLFLNPSSSFPQDEILIKSIEIIGENEVNTQQAMAIIPLQVGERFDIADMARAVSILKKTGLYNNIAIGHETAENNDGVRIVIKVEPRRFVRTVKFSGAFPLFESELRSAIRTREGVAYNTKTVNDDILRLKTFLQKEGYFDSRVEENDEVDFKTGDIIVSFTIKKGGVYNLSEIEIEGNGHLSAAWIKLEFRKFIPLRYRKEKADEAIEAIVEKYKDKGYYEAEVKIDRMDPDPALNIVKLHLKIVEGRLTKVAIRGNRHILDDALKKVLTFNTERTVDEYEIEASALEIRDYYRARGYLFADVTFTVSEKIDDKGVPFRQIRYNVDEGECVTVKKVKFVGAYSFDDKKLQKQMLTGRPRSFRRDSLLVESTLNDDLGALEVFYNTWGYLEVNIATPEIQFLNKKRTKANVVIGIDEGKQTVVRELLFEGNEFFTRDMLVGELALVEGAPFNEAMLSSDKRRFLIMYADHGFPYTKISQKFEYLAEGDAKAVRISYSVIEGKRVEVGETIIRGNYVTRGRVFMREIELQSGEPFSYSALLESRQNLRKLAFLYSVNLETLGLEEQMSIVHLLVNARERPYRSVDLGVGYDSDLGPNVWAEFTSVNLFGYGKTGKLKAMGGGDINRVEASYTDPRFLGSRLRADASIAWTYEDRPTFDLTQVGGKYSLTKIFSRHITGTLAARSAWSRLSNVEIAQFDRALVEDITAQDNTIFGIGPIMIYDTRDDFIDPSTGWYNRIGIEGVQEFVNDNRFVKFEAQASHYNKVVGSTVLALTALVGHIEPLGNSVVPLQEVYFLGGNRSVRGFSEDNLGPHLPDGTPTGGLDKIFANAEFRFPIWSIIHGVLFCDSGQLVPGHERFDFDKQQFTVGTGVRLMTPVGPVRVDWGYKLEPVWYEKRYRWHLSFGYPF